MTKETRIKLAWLVFLPLLLIGGYANWRTYTWAVSTLDRISVLEFKVAQSATHTCPAALSKQIQNPK